MPSSGRPGKVVAQLRAYTEAGIEELAVRWFDSEDSAGLEFLATDVPPQPRPAAA